jgi:hypothetical protein
MGIYGLQNSDGVVTTTVLWAHWGKSFAEPRVDDIRLVTRMNAAKRHGALNDDIDEAARVFLWLDTAWALRNTGNARPGPFSMPFVAWVAMHQLGVHIFSASVRMIQRLNEPTKAKPCRLKHYMLVLLPQINGTDVDSGSKFRSQDIRSYSLTTSATTSLRMHTGCGRQLTLNRL